MRLNQMARENYRLMQKFWLDVTKQDEYELAAEATELRKKRLWASTIRDALRLILDLRQGRLDVLFELFPWVKAKFEGATPPVPENDELRKRLDMMEQFILIHHSDSGLTMTDDPKSSRAGHINRPSTPKL